MALVDSVLVKIRDIFPGSSSRWDDTFTKKLIHLADCSIRSKIGSLFAYTDISLLADATYYALPTATVQVLGLLYSEDGTNFDDGVLRSTTYDRLDLVDPTWKDTRGERPSHYWLLSTPGVPGYSKFGIYPSLSGPSVEKVRVHFVACLPDNNATFLAQAEPQSAEWVEDAVYVPFVAAMMLGGYEQKMALHYWQTYTGNLAKAKTHYDSMRQEYIDSLGDWPGEQGWYL